MPMDPATWAALTAANAVVGQLSSMASSALAPATRSIGTVANIALPNLIPPVNYVTQAYWQGILEQEEYEKLLRANGIDVTGDIFGPIWRSVLRAIKPSVPVPIIGNLYSDNTWNNVNAKNQLRHAGLVDDDAIDAALNTFGAPDWNWVLEQRRLGQLDDATYAMLASVHGVGKNTYLTLLETSTSPLSQQDAFDLWRRGLIDDTRAAQHVAASGVIADPDSTAVFTRAYFANMPSIKELLAMFRLGLISVTDWTVYANAMGYLKGPSLSLIESQTNVFSPAQAIDLRMRGIIPSSDEDRHLLAGGWTAENDRSALRKLRFYNPSVQDLVRYQRNLDANTSAIDKLRLHTEYPQPVAQAAERTGWNDESITIGNREGVDVNISPAKAEWISHWQLPSGVEAVRMKFQLTPHRVQQLRAIGLNVDEITDDEVDGILQGNAIPPGWRKYVKASQYKQIPLRELIRITKFTDLPHRDLVDRFLQLGYVPEDAERIAVGIEKYLKAQENKQVDNEVHKSWTARVRAIKDGFDVGYISLQVAIQSLIGMGFTQEQAQQLLAVVAMDRNHRMAVAGVKAIEHAYATGEVNSAGALTALLKVGIDPSVATIYIQQWSLTHTIQLKHATTNDILKWLEDGIITQPQAIQRLSNIGWSSADILVIIADARHQIAKLQAQSAASAAKERKARSAALAAIVKQAEKTKKDAVEALKATASMKTLAKWWIEGVLTEGEVEARGKLIGYSIDDIHSYMNDALINQTKKEKAAYESKNPTSPNPEPLAISPGDS